MSRDCCVAHLLQEHPVLLRLEKSKRRGKRFDQLMGLGCGGCGHWRFPYCGVERCMGEAAGRTFVHIRGCFLPGNEGSLHGQQPGGQNPPAQDAPPAVGTPGGPAPVRLARPTWGSINSHRSRCLPNALISSISTHRSSPKNKRPCVPKSKKKRRLP